MTEDTSGITDEVRVELNGPQTPAPSAPAVPERPAGTAAKTKWLEYVVALGAHPDTVGSRAELIKLADRLGG